MEWFLSLVGYYFYSLCLLILYQTQENQMLFHEHYFS